MQARCNGGTSVAPVGDCQQLRLVGGGTDVSYLVVRGPSAVQLGLGHPATAPTRAPLPLAGAGEFRCPHTGSVYRLSGDSLSDI
jgi:hypothetical protein